MKEQSHKDEMSAAIRGDFQRLRERGVAVSLVPTDAEPVADAASQEEEPLPTDAEPVADAALREEEPAERAPSPLVADVHAEAPERTPEPPEMQDERAASQPGWLGRLLGR